MDVKIGEDGMPFVPVDDLPELSAEDIDDIRRAYPVMRTHERRLVVLRSRDVERLSTDPSLVQLPGAQYTAAVGIPDGRCATFLQQFMLMSNGEDHQRRRGAFARTFAHPVIKGKRAQVRAVADEIVRDLPRGEAFDFLDLCASRLPAEVIAEVLGLPTDESSWFASRVYSLSRCLMVPYVHADHDEIEAAAEELYTFVADALEARRVAPRDDLLSMLATDESARALEGEELIYQVMGVILAGSDTTRSGFNYAVGRLLQEPEIWAEVAANRDLIPAAIDEALRLDPPVGSMPRFVPSNIEIGGCPIHAGQVVGLSTRSAFRDEQQIEEPQRFNLHRDDLVQPHMVFGGAAHRCLGEMLARIEMEEGLAAVMDGAPGLELIEAPVMQGHSGIRKSTSLIVRIPE